MSEGLENIGKAILHTDQNGMISLQCNKCKSRFKLEGDYLNDLEGDIFCPICGISADLSCFYPEEVAEAAMKIAQAYAEEMIYKAFNKMNSKYLKVTTPKSTTVDKTIDFKDKDINMEIVHQGCCNRNISLLPIDIISSYYCPYCGRIVK